MEKSFSRTPFKKLWGKDAATPHLSPVGFRKSGVSFLTHRDVSANAETSRKFFRRGARGEPFFPKKGSPRPCLSFPNPLKSRHMATSSSLAVLILAAGKGTRMRSDLPKVLHPLAGRPLLAHVLHTVRALRAAHVVVVVGHQAGLVKEVFAGEPGLFFVVQEPQLGTGHAVMAAEPLFRRYQGDILILSGDVPGLRLKTINELIAAHRRRENDLTVLAMELSDPGHYGRLLTDGKGGLKEIREFRDATEEQRRIRLVNTGIYLARAEALFICLPLLKTDNDQKEYYLTDLVKLMSQKGYKTGYALCPDPEEVAGVNSQEELARLNAAWAGRAGKED